MSYAPGTNVLAIPENIAPMWPAGIPLDVNVYLSPSLILPPVSKMNLVVEERGFGYGDYKDKREISTTFEVPSQVQNNGTLWAHFLVGQSGVVLDPHSPKYDPSKAYHFVRPFSQYLPKKKAKKTRNLLSAVNETELDEEEDKTTTFASFYHPNFTLSFVPDSPNHQLSSMHPAM
jgi:hypothetical protein